MWRRGLLVVGAGGLAAAAASTALALSDRPAPSWLHDKLPSRQEQLRRLSQGTAANPFDVLIIGGEAWQVVTKGKRSDAVQISKGECCCTSGGRRVAAPPGVGSAVSPHSCRWRYWHRLRCGCCHQVRSASPFVVPPSACLPASAALPANRHAASPPPSPPLLSAFLRRGLKTAMVEREDFAAGTSSRSTKLVHGGVRYLEKARGC